MFTPIQDAPPPSKTSNSTDQKSQTAIEEAFATPTGPKINRLDSIYFKKVVTLPGYQTGSNIYKVNASNRNKTFKRIQVDLKLKYFGNHFIMLPTTYQDSFIFCDLRSGGLFTPRTTQICILEYEVLKNKEILFMEGNSNKLHIASLNDSGDLYTKFKSFKVLNLVPLNLSVCDKKMKIESGYSLLSHTQSSQVLTRVDRMSSSSYIHYHISTNAVFLWNIMDEIVRIGLRSDEGDKKWSEQRLDNDPNSLKIYERMNQNALENEVELEKVSGCYTGDDYSVNVVCLDQRRSILMMERKSSGDLYKYLIRGGESRSKLGYKLPKTPLESEDEETLSKFRRVFKFPDNKKKKKRRSIMSLFGSKKWTIYANQEQSGVIAQISGNCSSKKFTLRLLMGMAKGRRKLLLTYQFPNIEDILKKTFSFSYQYELKFKQMEFFGVLDSSSLDGKEYPMLALILEKWDGVFCIDFLAREYEIKRVGVRDRLRSISSLLSISQVMLSGDQEEKARLSGIGGLYFNDDRNFVYKAFVN